MNERRQRRRVIALKRFAACLLAAAGLFLSGCASVNTLVVLLPEEGGAPSAVTRAQASVLRATNCSTSVISSSSMRKRSASNAPLPIAGFAWSS